MNTRLMKYVLIALAAFVAVTASVTINFWKQYAIGMSGATTPDARYARVHRDVAKASIGQRNAMRERLSFDLCLMTAICTESAFVPRLYTRLALMDYDKHDRLITQGWIR
ncbi:hypothetical protein PMO31116_00516 [Pandoraea morbifera]|uniref:Uncharacterized protein n=1 Tax=Pandoraea morbifera TaxID=2508300 RepID=A0A5E4S2B8_9BURK|nr:hypothetical protein [Pandoraea morbifera]VVD69301.1 hypothetical protein PMO31116_00516 [Pandoraea morbifera]